MKLVFLILAGTLALGPLTPCHAQMEGINFRDSIAKYKDAGQWNLVVIYAQEWSRKEPQNSYAWNELSLAYSRLKQNDQALDAAKRALQLANQSPVLWSNLGHAHLTLNEPNAALKAFEEAVRWNPKDASSYTQIGFLHLRYERVREAKYSFDRALEANAEYSDAICGEGIVALRQNRLNDVKDYVTRLQPVDRACADSLEKHLALKPNGSYTSYNDFDSFGHPATQRAIAAWKRFSKNIDARCESNNSGWDCIHERIRLEDQFRELVTSGKVKL